MTKENILLLEAIEQTLYASNLTNTANILKEIIAEEKNIPLDAIVKPANGGQDLVQFRNFLNKKMNLYFDDNQTKKIFDFFNS